MAITMQGSWTVRVRARHAAYAQRFVVTGAEQGNGVHDGIVGQEIHVSGAHWALQVQHRPTRQPWRDSFQRLGLPSVEGGLLRVPLTSNDGGLDDDYDDLVIECSMPVSRHEHVVYGEVAWHTSASPFNPRRDDYLVIDAPFALQALEAQFPALAPVIAKLYPQRVSAATNRDPDLSPLVIPNGLPGVGVGLRFESRPGVIYDPADEAAAVDGLRASVGRVPFQSQAMAAGVAALSAGELASIARLRDRVMREASEGAPAPGLAVRLQRYHRSPDEAAGGPYRGNGLREELGHTVADECGRYLFRFRQDERSPDPDLIVQVGPAGRAACFESAPYDQVTNLRRIDLSVPRAVALAARAPGVSATSTIFEYVGTSSLTVVGPASGRCYRFDGPGARLVVDPRDRDTLAHIRSLRRPEAA